MRRQTNVLTAMAMLTSAAFAGSGMVPEARAGAEGTVMTAAAKSTTSWVTCVSDAGTPAAERFALQACDSLLRMLGETGRVERLPSGRRFETMGGGQPADRGVNLSLTVRGESHASGTLEYGTLAEWAAGKQRRTAQLDVNVMDAKLSERSAERLVAALMKLLKRG